MDEEARARHFAAQLRIIDRTTVAADEAYKQEAADARSELERMMTSGEASSSVISRAITIAVEYHGAASIPGKIAQVTAYLQRKLTEEHVAAQARIAKAAEHLARATYALALIGVLLAIAQAWPSLSRFLIAVLAVIIMFASAIWPWQSGKD